MHVYLVIATHVSHNKRQYLVIVTYASRISNSALRLKPVSLGLVWTSKNQNDCWIQTRHGYYSLRISWFLTEIRSPSCSLW